MVTNPASVAVDYAFDNLIRGHFFKGVRFDAPAGDLGWFGPETAVWYVHEHTPALVLGLFASAAIETLHPDFAWMGQDHSRGVRRVDGEPVGLDPKGLLTRAGHSYSFFMAVAYGASDAAERVTRAVRGMHHTIRGVRPDGRPYDADDPETLRWAYATVVWGLAAAHERYHPRPLRGDDLDGYYREFTRVGEALGGTDLPATKAEVLDCLRESVPLMGVTMPTVEFFAGLGGKVAPAPLRPTLRMLRWAVTDLAAALGAAAAPRPVGLGRVDPAPPGRGLVGAQRRPLRRRPPAGDPCRPRPRRPVHHHSSAAANRGLIHPTERSTADERLPVAAPQTVSP